jgi:hypothetical protein
LLVCSAYLSDISSLELVDSFIGWMLTNTSAMVYALGAQAVAIGMHGKSSRREAGCALWLFMDERSHVSGEGVGGVISTLRRFRQPQNVQERCELCGVGLSRNHRHLLEISQSQIVCACDPCAFRFQDVIEGRLKLIPKDVWCLPQFTLSDTEWENLALPINLAFFFYSTPEKKMKALYPSPAGATESLLPLEAWNSFAERDSRVRTMQSDVEALLVNLVGTKREYYIVPIDVCFELVGLIRMHWHGLSGGDAVWQQVEAFFARLSANARSLPAPS